MVAAIGQIPFTLLHLAGTIGFSIFLSPVLYRWVATNDAFELGTQHADTTRNNIDPLPGAVLS